MGPGLGLALGPALGPGRRRRPRVADAGPYPPDMSIDATEPGPAEPVAAEPVEGELVAGEPAPVVMARLVAAAQDTVGASRVRIGVTGVEAFADVRTEIERRKASGESGDLGFVYRDAETATEPLRSFPWARSIIVAAVAYLRDGDGSGASDRSVARFADGDRYADLRSVLSAMEQSLTSGGHRAESVLDDDRLVDRAVAVRSGIAWWGKSTMALAPGMGPWFLIGRHRCPAAGHRAHGTNMRELHCVHPRLPDRCDRRARRPRRPALPRCRLPGTRRHPQGSSCGRG